MANTTICEVMYDMMSMPASKNTAAPRNALQAVRGVRNPTPSSDFARQPELGAHLQGSNVHHWQVSKDELV
jgi:hypothetical protein